MDNPVQQAMIDQNTWFPVAFLSFIEIDDQMILHQMWVSALGQTEWRKIETRNLSQMVKAYAECKSFAAGNDIEPIDDKTPF